MELLGLRTRSARRGAARAASGVGALLAVALAGCAAGGPRAASQPAVPRGNAELVTYLTEQPLVTAEGAYRAAYLLKNRAAFEGDFEALRARLLADGLIGASWQDDPAQFVNRAQVGYMICRACDVRTGVNWRLTGLGRYAWRELQYHGIASGGSELGSISGGEFVGILARAGEYRQARKPELPRVELGAEPERP